MRRITHEVDGRFDFRPHRAGAELAGVQVPLSFVRGNLLESLFVRFAVAGAGVVDRSEDHQRWRLQMTSQQSGSAILVDDGRHAAHSAIRVDGHWYAAAPAAYDYLPTDDQTFNRRHLDNLP